MTWGCPLVLPENVRYAEVILPLHCPRTRAAVLVRTFLSHRYLARAAACTLLLSLPRCLSSWAAAQESPIEFEPVALWEGLYSHSVRGITQDRQGYIYVCGVAHLFRYDGYGFLRIAMPRADTLFLRWTKLGLAGGRNGVLCLYGLTNELLFYHTELDSAWLLRLPAHVGGPDSVLSTSIVLEDSRGRFWIGTTDGVLFCVRPNSAEIEPVGPRNGAGSGAPLGLITFLAEDSSGSVWVGSVGGLFRVDAQAATSESYDSRSSLLRSATVDSVLLIAADKDGRLWVAMEHRRFGWLNTHTGVFSACPRIPIPNPTPWLTAMCVERSGDVWLATGSDGLLKWRPATRSWDYFRNIAGEHKGGTPTQIWELFADRTGVLWIGTNWQGLLKRVPWRRKFQSCTPATATPGGLSAAEISAAWKDRYGGLWVGTMNNGLNYLEPRSTRFRHLKSNPQIPGSLGSNLVTCILERRIGELWVGTAPGGISRFEREKGTFYHFEHRRGDPWGLDKDVVNALYEDRHGIVWVGHLAGVDRYEDRAGEFHPFIRWPKETVGRTGTAGYFCEDTRGNLWIATEGRGLLRINRAAGDSVWYHHDAENTGSLPSNSVHFLCAVENGGLWLGTPAGLARYDYDTDSFHAYRIHGPHSQLRLPPEGARYMASLGVDVAGIVPDLKGNLWLSSSVGIVKFCPWTGASRVFTADDGVPFGRGMRHAAFRAPEGTIYLGGLGGLTWFHPDSIQENPLAPPVVITEFRVFQDAQWVLLVSGQEIRLEHWQDTFSFEFAALDYAAPQQNQFMYKLEGAETDWVLMGTDRRVSFANVRPGRYTLRVRGSNSDGIWNEAGIAIPITVSPPYWQTWWFRAALVFGLGLLLYGGFRYRLATLMAVEKLRLRIAQDLHDDIGSTLSGIALTSDQLVGRLSNDPQAKRDLQELRQVAVEKAEHLRDLVWTINPSKDSSDDLLLYLKETAHRLLRGIDVRFTMSQDESGGKMTLEVKHNVTMIFREVLHNVLSHSRARCVEIEATERTGMLRLRVADDGVGFDPGTCRRGNGLANLEQRARAIGGEIKVESSPGAGTTVTLEAKIT